MRVRHIGHALTFSLLVVALIGCVADPQPVPLPGINGQALKLSGALGGTTSYLLAGLPGAVPRPDGSQAVVRNLRSGRIHRNGAASDGSFLVEVVRAGATDELEAWVEQAERISPKVAVPLPDPAAPPVPPAPFEVQGVSPAAGGQVTLTGAAGTELVVIGNRTASASASARVRSDGSWSAQIGGAAGHRLSVFEVVEATGVSSTPIEVTVP